MYPATQRRRGLVYLFTLIISLLLFTACEAKPEFKGILWKVTDPKHNKQDRKFYILGSIHTVSKQDIYFSQAIRTSLEGASTVVLESDPDRVVGDIQRFTNTNLSSYIDEETKNKIVAYLTETGFQKTQIEKAMLFHPYALFRYLSETAKPTKRALEKYQYPKILKYPGIDSRLMRLATDGRKTIEFLETDDDVMRIWSEMCPSKAEYSAIISQVIDHLTGAKQVDKRIYEAHLAFEQGNTLHLTNWFLSSEYQQSAGVSIIRKCSLVPRNFFWKNKIIDYLRSDENTLVVVGAAHLLGKDSLVELLRAEGFVLEAVD
jgi:uncharacterized protein